ncbi:MAG: hypothetical protein WC201_02880 [Bacilli bacterium]
MRKKVLIPFATIAIIALMTVPLAFGSVGSVTVANNEIIVTEIANAGILSPDKTIKQTTHNGHIAYRVEYNSLFGNGNADGNAIGLGTSEFQILVPGNVYLCIMAQTAGHFFGRSSLTMEIQGTDFTADAPQGTFYFSTENSIGNVMTPMSNLDDVVFMMFEEDTLIDCIGHREGVQCPMKIHLIFL